jgi:hypothetical protein
MMTTATAEPAGGRVGGGRRLKEDAVMRAAEPVVHRLSSGEAGDLRALATRIYTNCEYFVIETGVLSVALISRDDLDEYLEWREERIQDPDVQEALAEIEQGTGDAACRPTGIRRVSIDEVGDLGDIAMRICRNNECFVLEKDGILPVAFIDPIDLDNYLDWRTELMEALAESERDVREGRTRPAEALLAELKQDVGLAPDRSTTRRD